MKQLTQNLRTGKTSLMEVSKPRVSPGQVLIQTTCSLVSVGTERKLVAFGRANWLHRALMQPERFGEVIKKIKMHGLRPTWANVKHRLDEPLGLGYSQAGVVVGLGEGVTDLQLGDRVASNGPHAELVSVSRHLVVKIPDQVTDAAASFTVLGSIGLQGLRMFNPTLGETVVVIGLGLIGILTADLLLINGCIVIGTDPNPSRLALAKSRGCRTVSSQDARPEATVKAMTDGQGADGVIITAQTASDGVMKEAAAMCRKGGRIILVGEVGLQLQRTDFYKKELSFRVSCSYGPGRYDPAYEEDGLDYPLAYVRWTEHRNLQTVMHLIASGQLEVESLIAAKVALKDFLRIYGDLHRKPSGAYLLVFPEYKDSVAPPLDRSANIREIATIRIGIIGAGQYTRMTLLPALSDISVEYIASAHGLSASSLAQKYKIPSPISDHRIMLADPQLDLVLIVTRHYQHAPMVVEALEAGKHVFVEKPLALTVLELEQIALAYQTSTKILHVGYNRRFAPLVEKLKQMLPAIPLQIVVTVNAGRVDASSWVQDPVRGGGRILGEACHFIDLMSFLTNSLVRAVCMQALGHQASVWSDNVSILLQFHNGSTGVLNYFSNGSMAYPKEKIEVFGGDCTWLLEDFRSLKAYGLTQFSSIKKEQDKGHRNQFRQLIRVIKSGLPPLIPPANLFNTSYASLAALTSFRERRWVMVEHNPVE
ncbi:bi-domain-containing oxidoreductase [Dyadobacter tibetensis]|uniref:bi-domain-containing oxidoreductase n=1 Tax=Dyadobacter tibetensis TaxID=1211851 RepID=UPI000472E721|nr:bi-domain-containing oxidoreductase [Dyadobacter tibetensis]